MISASMVKIAALGGIALVWWELTRESIKLGEKIIFSSWREQHIDDCEECEQHIDDEEIYDGEERVEKCEDPSCEICI